MADGQIVGRDTAKIMNRADLTRRLVAKLQNREAVIGGIGYTNFDLWASGQRPENFYMLGSMGLAVPIALGVALAQPARRVFALEGDGSLLMQLGALGTVAAARSKNLAIIVWDNGAYQITGAQLAGLRGIVLMQTSGFATLANVLASLAIPYQIPVLMMISERGTLGEFNLGQAAVLRTVRPVLESLGIEHYAITRLDEVEFVVDRMIKQAFFTRVPAAMILSPLLTKRNTEY